jgi:2-keto-4-pentenoate hydratase/2-oxohepta-3-ene-1,7-dioic acid hydratase in catechol pathway
MRLKMKLLSYKNNGAEAVGILTADGKNICPIKEMGFSCNNMMELIYQMNEKVMERIKLSMNNQKEGLISLERTELLAPIPVPAQDVICLGVNYIEHAKESAKFKIEEYIEKRQYPIYFSKRVNEAVADGGYIDSHPGFVKQLDYEAELAVVIGRDAKDVPEEEVLEYIFGYTILNDISARVIQNRHKQWYFGKSLDGFTPMGPWIVTADEFEFPAVMKIQSTVNGELRQNSSTDLMIFNIPYIIHQLSSGMTLKAGTIISTGTPAGVGMGFQPPRFLKPGDIVTCSIEGIGSITNEVK